MHQLGLIQSLMLGLLGIDLTWRNFMKIGQINLSKVVGVHSSQHC